MQDKLVDVEVALARARALVREIEARALDGIAPDTADAIEAMAAGAAAILSAAEAQLMSIPRAQR